MKMQLHRTGRRPQWAGVRAERRNAWQQVAARSGGVLTIGNFFTLVGFGLVMVGLGYVVAAGRSGNNPDYYGAAFALVVLGRACDLLDGWLADKTGTKSPLGEKLDAGFDKLITLFALIALVVATILPWWAAILLILPHAAIAAVSVYLFSQGRAPHPSRAGKLSMAAAWASLSLAVLTAALNPSLVWVSWLAYGFGVLSVVLGWAAAAGYVRQSTK